MGRKNLRIWLNFSYVKPNIEEVLVGRETIRRTWQQCPQLKLFIEMVLGTCGAKNYGPDLANFFSFLRSGTEKVLAGAEKL